MCTMYAMCLQARFGAAPIRIPCARGKVRANITLATHDPTHTTYCNSIYYLYYVYTNYLSA